MYPRTISKEEIAELPLCGFEGEIVVISTPEQWKKYRPEIFSEEVLGFDTETRPSFKKGKRNGVALLQLSTCKKAYLIRLCKTGILPGIGQLLSTDTILKIGVGLRDDIRELQVLQDFQPRGFIDLQDYVRAFRIDDASLVKITAIVLGCRISKSQQLSNWEADTLTEKQMRYAATDAWAACKVYLMLKEKAQQHVR